MYMYVYDNSRLKIIITIFSHTKCYMCSGFSIFQSSKVFEHKQSRQQLTHSFVFRTLGYHSGQTNPSQVYSPEHVYPVWLGDVVCLGYHNTFGQCALGPVGGHSSCTNPAASTISVVCYPNAPTGMSKTRWPLTMLKSHSYISLGAGYVNFTIFFYLPYLVSLGSIDFRITGGGLTGSVEIGDGGLYGLLCENTFWTSVEATVICRNANYQYGIIAPKVSTNSGCRLCVVHLYYFQIPTFRLVLAIISPVYTPMLTVPVLVSRYT